MLVWLAMVTEASGQSLPSLRDQEIASCQPGEVVTWADGRDRPAVGSTMVFVYRHDGAPSWFSPEQVESALQSASAAWSRCGVVGKVATESQLTRSTGTRIIVQWSEEGSPGNFGLAHLGNRTLNLGPQAFHLLQQVNPGADASQVLQMVISHEMGHLYGVMAHSRRCVDVTSYYANGKGQTCTIRGGFARPPGVEYRAPLPTACDIERCRAANGMR